MRSVASNNDYVDIKTDPEYSGRVQYICGNNDCTLRITDLRESDSAEYKFRFITNQHNGKYTGSPGVTLSVTDLQVQVSRSEIYTYYDWAELKCHSSCLPGHLYYVWYKNGQKTWRTTSSFSVYVYPADSYSCAAEGYEKFPSPPVCEFTYNASRDATVSVSPSVEGSSVNLTCSSDANPAANYTWYKENEDSPKTSGQIFTITDFRPEHSGNYYCEAQNRRGRHNSTLHLNILTGIFFI
uniref:B-cell receptor CD22 n=1 Tax=Dicentrarchus labrax TaxID=13489 RepID=A0A8P4GKL6_DICLA